MTLLLFDIDGTLVRVNGTGRTAVTEALSTVMARSISTEAVSFSGRTDPSIVRAVLESNGISPTESAIQAALEAYVSAMKESLTPEDVDVLPGVSSLLSALHDHPEIQLGLVTGNVEPIAYEKLAAHSLDHYFPTGAFGSDHANRNRLPALAMQRATDHTGHSFRADNTVIIGDTAHDIECARSAGARAMAVGTGRYGPNELSKHDPDILLNRLPDPSAFLQKIRA